MIQQSFLDSAEGLVRTGSETERVYGRGHYRDLLASFSGAQLLTGKFGSTEIGFIDPTMLTGDEPERLLLLAGRSWLVKDIEWSRKLVWLEPAKEGGKARWMGGARSLSREVCQGIRAALASDFSPVVKLSLRAKAELAALQNELAVSVDARFMARVEGAEIRTWTFAGTKLNRTYARRAGHGAAHIKFDALSVQAPPAALVPEHEVTEVIVLTNAELKILAEGVKFAPCVPSAWLSRTIVARLFSQGL